jgi:hypothetical protein
MNSRRNRSGLFIGRSGLTTLIAAFYWITSSTLRCRLEGIAIQGPHRRELRHEPNE